MEQYVIKGGNPLVGEVEIAGAKNAALAILSAAIMTDETILIENLPDVRDINVLLNREGFYLPWNDKQIELFFGSLKQEMTTADWNDEEGNKIRLVFTPQIVNEDGYETTLNVIEVEYYTIEQIVEQIRRHLHAQKNNNE